MLPCYLEAFAWIVFILVLWFSRVQIARRLGFCDDEKAQPSGRKRKCRPSKRKRLRIKAKMERENQDKDSDMEDGGVLLEPSTERSPPELSEQMESSSKEMNSSSEDEKCGTEQEVVNQQPQTVVVARPTLLERIRSFMTGEGQATGANPQAQSQPASNTRKRRRRQRASQAKKQRRELERMEAERKEAETAQENKGQPRLCFDEDPDGLSD